MFIGKYIMSHVLHAISIRLTRNMLMHFLENVMCMQHPSKIIAMLRANGWLCSLLRKVTGTLALATSNVRQFHSLSLTTVRKYADLGWNFV